MKNFIHPLIFATFLSNFGHIFSREFSEYFFPIHNSNFKPQVCHFSSDLGGGGINSNCHSKVRIFKKILFLFCFGHNPDKNVFLWGYENSISSIIYNGEYFLFNFTLVIVTWTWLLLAFISGSVQFTSIFRLLSSSRHQQIDPLGQQTPSHASVLP